MGILHGYGVVGATGALIAMFRLSFGCDYNWKYVDIILSVFAFEYCTAGVFRSNPGFSSYWTGSMDTYWGSRGRDMIRVL